MKNQQPLTVTLRNGRTVLAKRTRWDGPCAKTFANRTQAEKAAAACGGHVLVGYPFLVQVEREPTRVDPTSGPDWLLNGARAALVEG
jgi:hypothetical protein